MWRRLAMIGGLLLACLPASGLAGSAASGESHFTPDEISRFAKSVEHYAANAGARAFIIARQGRPEAELPDGILFTHTALAIYSSITTDDGRELKGYAIHNLYQKADKRDESMLVQDFPVDFFWPVQSLKAGILIPTPELQQALIEMIARKDHLALHNPAYSAIASPFNERYQNCTEYTLDLINAAIYETTDTARLKANARAHFQAAPIRENPLKMFLGGLFAVDIKLDDHKGEVATATFTTIARYLQDNGFAESSTILLPDGPQDLWLSSNKD